MKYIITEEQLRKVKDGILKLSYDIFDNDWDALQQFITRRDSPPYILIGNVNLRDRKDIKSLGSLVQINGDLIVARSGITSIGKLERVHGELNMFDSPVNSLGNLTWVAGSLNVNETKIQSLGKLEYVGDDLWLRKTPLTKMNNWELDGKIRNKMFVGGTIYL